MTIDRSELRMQTQRLLAHLEAMGASQKPWGVREAERDVTSALRKDVAELTPVQRRAEIGALCRRISDTTNRAALAGSTLLLYFEQEDRTAIPAELFAMLQSLNDTTRHANQFLGQMHVFGERVTG